MKTSLIVALILGLNSTQTLRAQETQDSDREVVRELKLTQAPRNPQNQIAEESVVLTLDDKNAAAWGGDSFAYIASPGRSATKPLIIQTGKTAGDAAPELEEDLTVMSRILSRAVEGESTENRRERAMGINLLVAGTGRRPQSIYLDDFGAVFLLNVRYPLLAPARKDERKVEKEVNSTWEQTRRELYSRSPGNLALPLDGIPEETAHFDEKRVEQLTSDLVGALKHAANIRHLGGNESVVLVVSGTGPNTVRKASQIAKGSGATGTGRRAELFAWSDSQRSTGGESTLSIRARKSDIDAFAKGELAADEFRKKAQISAY